MKVKLKNNIVNNKLLALKLFKLNTHKKLYGFRVNLNAIKLDFKHLIRIIYKYKIHHKQILVVNTFNNIFFCKLSLIKFLFVYRNKVLLKGFRLFLKNHLILILGKQSQFNLLQKTDVVWIPLIFLKNDSYWYANLNFKNYKNIIVYNFLLLLLNINEFKKTKN